MFETTTKPTTSSTTDAASPTLDVQASQPGAAPAVLALAGTKIQGGGQFEYLVLPDATFEVTKVPPNTKPGVIGRLLRPDNEYKDAWKKLTDEIVADAKAKAPDVPGTGTGTGTTTGTAPAPRSIGTIVLDGIASVGAELSGIVDAGTAWLEELLFGVPAPGGDAPTTQPTEQAPTQAAPAEKAPAAVDPAAALGKEDNLATAVELMGTLHQSYEQYTSDSGTKCKTGLIGGNAQDLTTLNCGQFTAAVLGEAGYDLNTEWIDPGTGLPVAYVDGESNEKGTSITFVTAFMMINAQTEATGAALDAQRGPISSLEKPVKDAKVTRVEGAACADYTLATNKSQNARFKTADGAEPAAPAAPADRAAFLVATSKTFVGIEAEAGQAFGAGAAALLFGGALVDDPAKRMPGDIQQRLDLNASGAFNGLGHSSTVYAVKGTGTCYFDPNLAGSAKPADGKLDRAAGWYTGLWIVDSATDPKCVSSFSLTQVQMIDANLAGNLDQNGDRRTQAVAIGGFHEPEGAESIGRLPTSKWLGWKDGNVPAVDPKPL